MQNRKTFLITKYLLVSATLTILLSQILFSRGLALDGVHILYRMIITKSFYFIETARVSFHFLQQLPSWLFINFSPSNSLNLITMLFSFGLIWIHIFSLYGCYLILPKAKKDLIFFPIFSFFVGPVTGLGASISASLSLFSYVWFIVYFLYYSNLSLKLNKFLFFIISIPLFLSHEMMIYVAYLLMSIYIFKTKYQSNKIFTHIMISYFMILSLFSLYFVLFPVPSEIHNRASFINSLLKLEFFIKIKEGQILWLYPACLISFCLMATPFIQLLPKKYYQKIYFSLLSLLIFFGSLAIISPFYELFNILKLTEEEEARVWISCIAMPISLLIWYLFESKQIKFKFSFLIACLVGSMSLMLWRVGSDYQFYQFQKQYSKKIFQCKGFVAYKDTANQKISKTFNLFNQKWKYLSSSLIYPRQNNISCVIKPEDGLPICYNNLSYGMCENNMDFLKESKFFNFKKLISYEKKLKDNFLKGTKILNRSLYHE